MLISYEGDDHSENSFCYEEILNLNINESRNVTVKRTKEFSPNIKAKSFYL